MDCRDNKQKFLDGEGLLFYTQVVYNAVEDKIRAEISKAIVEKTLAANPAIISKINEMLDNGTLATNEVLNAKVQVLNTAINAAKEQAVSDAIAQFDANVKALAKRYAQEVYDENESEEINIDELASAIMTSAEFKNQFIKKNGDTMTGALTVQGNVTGAKFVTSSGITFF